MTGAEILALIGSFATGSVATGMLSSALYDGVKNAFALRPITDARKNSISRQWSGSFTQGTQNYTVTMTLETKRKRVIGSGYYTDSQAKVNLEFSGGFYRDDHLHLNYKNKDDAVFQHGLIIFHIPNNPQSLSGKFVGIGRNTNQIVGGDINVS